MTLSEIDIENVVIFVADAVRFDAVERKLNGYGQFHKTMAASLHTPASFASMFTGLCVPTHGVTGFSDILQESIPSLATLEDVDCSFSTKTGTMHEDLHRIFQNKSTSKVSDTTEPFVWIVRDPGGHAPYNGYDPETYEQRDETGPEYLNRVAGDRETIESDYQDAVDNSIQRFNEVRTIIEERGLEEETLLIYTSDHGELLGEYGMLGHNHVACPELVYVPTVFCHPSLENGRDETPIRHIDLFPTIIQLLDIKIEDAVEGKPLWEIENPVGYNHFEMVFYNSPLLKDIEVKVRSCWDDDGGHVFVESSYKDALLVYLGVLTKSYKGKQIRKDRAYIEALKQFIPGHLTYGTPSFNKDRAEELINQVETRSDTTESVSLDSETKDRLEELGYI